MISCTEFIWVYSELFRYLDERGGKDEVFAFWKGISDNFLGNLREYIRTEGLKGMHKYWTHTLGEEGGRSILTLYDDTFIIDMHDCPSARLVHQSGRVAPYESYCEHCRHLYPPLIREYGYEVDYDVISCEKGRCRMTVKRPPGAVTPDAPARASDS
ncbi:MAG: hypothetical protein IT364_05205 [Candidatus Hydrogenedentes bacterium]|nr:hypothetical protein [Candidatus Hydrogenedentota bacterium]